nr:uncharacterized protein LOC119163625 [Rhipicephalus microplus]
MSASCGRGHKKVQQVHCEITLPGQGIAQSATRATHQGWCPPLFGGSLTPVSGEGTSEGGQRHGGVSGSRPPAVMGLRFRRLRRMSSGEDVVTASSPSSGAQHLQQPGGSTQLPNNGSSEEEEACDGLAELSRPVRPLPIKDGYLHVLSGDRVWFRLYVALHAEKLDAYYELSDKVPVISVSLAGCEVVTPDKVTGSAPGEVCFPIQLIKKVSGEVKVPAAANLQICSIHGHDDVIHKMVPGGMAMV